MRYRKRERDWAIEKGYTVLSTKDMTDNMSLCFCHDSSTYNHLIINKCTEAENCLPRGLFQQEKRLKILYSGFAVWRGNKTVKESSCFKINSPNKTMKALLILLQVAWSTSPTPEAGVHWIVSPVVVNSETRSCIGSSYAFVRTLQIYHAFYFSWWHLCLLLQVQ